MPHTASTETGAFESMKTTVSRREFLTISAAGVGAVTAVGYGLSAKGADASASGAESGTG